MALAAAAISTAPAAATDIRVVASGAPAEIAKRVADAFTASTGHRVLFRVGTMKVMLDEIAAGGQADVLILPAPVMEGLERKGAVRPGSRMELARVGIGVAVPGGAPLPDISTAGALRQTLLDARAIVHPDPQGGGFTGAQIARVMQALGIADAVKPKTTLLFAIGGGVEMVVKGEADIGLFNISEILPFKGAKLVGPLPPEFQHYIDFSGALHANSAAPEVAQAFLRSLTEPQARDAWTAGGFEPLGGGR